MADVGQFRFIKKFAIKLLSLSCFPPHVNHLAILPCETYRDTRLKINPMIFSWPKSIYYCDLGLSLTNCTFVKLELRVHGSRDTHISTVTLGNLTGVVALTKEFSRSANSWQSYARIMSLVLLTHNVFLTCCNSPGVSTGHLSAAFRACCLIQPMIGRRLTVPTNQHLATNGYTEDSACAALSPSAS